MRSDHATAARGDLAHTARTKSEIRAAPGDALEHEAGEARLIELDRFRVRRPGEVLRLHQPSGEPSRPGRAVVSQLSPYPVVWPSAGQHGVELLDRRARHLLADLQHPLTVCPLAGEVPVERVQHRRHAFLAHVLHEVAPVVEPLQQLGRLGSRRRDFAAGQASARMVEPGRLLAGEKAQRPHQVQVQAHASSIGGAVQARDRQLHRRKRRDHRVDVALGDHVALAVSL